MKEIGTRDLKDRDVMDRRGGYFNSPFFLNRMDCEKVKNIALDYVNHRLSEDLVTSTEEHLCICEECRNYLGTILNKEDVPPKSGATEVVQKNGEVKPRKKSHHFISYFILGIAFILVLFLIHLFLKSQHLVIK